MDCCCSTGASSAMLDCTEAKLDIENARLEGLGSRRWGEAAEDGEALGVEGA